MDPRMADADYAANSTELCTTKDTPQRQHAQSQDKRNTRVLWLDSLQPTATASLRGLTGTKFAIIKGACSHPGLSRSVQQHAQEYGRTNWNLRGFSRTGRRVTKPRA
jgi:hypothetical protein